MVLLGFTWDEWFTVRGGYVLSDCFPKHAACAVSQTTAMRTDGDTLRCSVCKAGVNSACIFDSQTSAEKPSHVLL